jgi:serine/threonine-protein kinase
LLGEGQFTLVYEARPRDCPSEWPSDYAVKLLHPRHHGDRVAAGVIQREAHVARLVSHPRLISILSAHVDGPPFYLVMPRLHGTTLESIVQRASTTALPRALWIGRQTAEALAALHCQGWLHSDVKPSNIFVSPAGRVTLIDLGFARRWKSSQDCTESSIAGTFAYAAPETFSLAATPGPHSDVYSLGVTLYQLLTGSLPFSQTDPVELAAAHLHHLPPDPRLLVPQLPLRVARLLKRMLAKQPLRRPEMTELIRLLVELEIESFDEWI